MPSDKNEKMPLKHSCVCVKHFTEDSFKQNLVVTSLMGAYFKLAHLVVKKRATKDFQLHYGT